MAIRNNNISSRKIYIGTNTEIVPNDGDALISGNVGIGTNSPNQKLQVNGDVYSTLGLYSDHTYSGNRNWRIITNNFGSGNWGGIAIQTSTGAGLDPNTTRFGIDYLGKVGIGTTSPVRRLTVDSGNASDIVNFQNNNGSITLGQTSNLSSIDLATSNAFRIRQGSTVPFFIKSDGKVGMGTTNPGAKLHVSSSVFPQVRINDDSSFGESGIRFRSSNTSNVDLHGDIFIDGTGEETGRMGFRIPYNDTEKLTILHNGNVGIGTTIPDKQLTFVQSTDDAIQIRRYTTTQGNPGEGTGISWTWSSSSTDTETWAAIRTIMPGSGNTHMTFSTKPSGGNNAERMRIDSTGNVGIGTTSPSTKLDVQGAVTIKGTGTGTSGSLAIQDDYSGANHLANIGWIRSSGGVYLSYGLKQENSTEWKSTYANFSGERTYAKLDNNEFSMAYAPAQNTAVGTAVTGLTEKFKFYLNTGVLRLNSYSAGILTTDSSGTVGLAGSGDLPGGPYLPLSAGSGEILTGDLAMNNNIGIITKDSSGVFKDILKLNSSNVLEIGSSALNTNTIFRNTGNVGIGTTSPNHKLDVLGGSGNDVIAKFKTTGTGTGDYSEIHIANNNEDRLVIGSIGSNYTNSSWAGMRYVYATAGDLGLKATASNGNVRIYTGGAGNERMRITSTGNVGIGTTSPGYKLDVNGDARSTHFRDGSKGTGTTSTTAGWYKVASWTGGSKRGGSEIKLSTTGGSFTPITWIIRCYKNWSGDATLKLEQYGYSNIYFTKARVEYDSTAAVYYLEIYQPGTTAVTFNMYQTSLMGYDSNVTMVTGTLAAGTTGGTTRTELPFIAGGTSVEALTIGNSGNTGPYLPLAGGTITGNLTVNGTTTLGNQLTFPYGYLSDYIYHTGDSNTYFGFVSNDNFIVATSGAERMRINGSGNVGIGTTSPAGRLELNGSGQSWSTAPGIRMWDSFNSKGWFVGSANNIDAGDFYIRTLPGEDTNPGSSQQEFTIKHASGNVGIGTTSPGAKLEVNGQTVINSTGLTEGFQWFNDTNEIFSLEDTSGAGELLLLSSNSVKVKLNANGNSYFNGGNVGINNTSPVNGKLVVTSTEEDLLNTVRIQHTRSNSNFGSKALEIDMNLSGADTTTADRTNRGIYVDLDSSADGDAANEHRIRGIESDVRFTGFSDIVRAGQFYAESNNITEKTAQLVGVYGQAVHDAGNAAGGVSNMIGAYGYSSIQDLGDVDNAFGVYGLVDIGDNRGNADVGVTKAVEGEISINKSTALNYGTMIGISSIIDNNEGSVPNFGDQYLFKGDYQGTKGSNAYGIYTEGDKHYFDGKVGIGNTSPDEKLEVSGSGASDYPSIKISNPSQTGRYMRIGMIDSINHCIEANGGSTYLTFKTNATERMRIDTSGNVGIGTTSPSHKLEVGLTSSVALSAQPAIPLMVSNNGNSVDGRVFIQVKNDVVNTASAIGAGLQMTAAGVTSGTASYENSLIFLQSKQPGNQTIHSAPQNIKFYVDNDGTAAGAGTDYSALGDVALELKTNGDGVFYNKLGIGTTSPGAKLDVSDTTTGVGAIIGNTTHNSRLQIYTAAASKNSEIWFGDAADADVGKIDYDHANNSLAFTTNTSERMRINSNGNVGIGTTSPGQKLTVNSGRVLISNTTTPIYIKAGSAYKSWVHHIGGGDEYIFAPSTADNGETWDWSNQTRFDTSGVVRANNFVLASDKRLKTNIKNVSGKQIKANWKTFEMIADKTKAQRHGVIAQELEEVHPEFVRTDNEGIKSVAYTDLLIAKIAELEARLEKLEK
jgi:fibronectin-binding autotransporter adhesin